MAGPRSYDLTASMGLQQATAFGRCQLAGLSMGGTLHHDLRIQVYMVVFRTYDSERSIII